jgi:hypothetical protein
MPLLPKSISSKVVSNRHAAWGESMALGEASDCFTVFAMTGGFARTKDFARAKGLARTKGFAMT